MAAITEKMGLNYDLDGTEPDYFTKVNENTLKIDAFLPLCAISQIDLADLPVTPTDGEIYVVDASLIYIRQQSTWYTFPLPCGISFYDQTLTNFYKYDGTNIFLDTGVDGVLDAANVGGQVEVYRDKINGVINFKTLEAGSGMTLDDTDPDKIILEASVGGFPAGTAMLFMQAAAPVGWTLDTTNNDRFVRISNSAGGGVSGSWANFNHSHTHSHTHTEGTLQAMIGINLADDVINLIRSGTGFPGGGNGTDRWATGGIGNDTTNDDCSYVVDVQGDTGGASNNFTSTTNIAHGSTQHSYIDAIICTKD